MGALAEAVQGYTGERPAQAAATHGIALEVVRPPAAKRGFVLPPRRWVIERSFNWMARFRRLARDCELLPGAFAGLHLLAFTILPRRRAQNSPSVRSTFSVQQ